MLTQVLTRDLGLKCQSQFPRRVTWPTLYPSAKSRESVGRAPSQGSRGFGSQPVSCQPPQGQSQRKGVSDGGKRTEQGPFVGTCPHSTAFVSSCHTLSARMGKRPEGARREVTEKFDCGLGDCTIPWTRALAHLSIPAPEQTG